MLNRVGHRKEVGVRTDGVIESQEMLVLSSRGVNRSIVSAIRSADTYLKSHNILKVDGRQEN